MKKYVVTIARFGFVEIAAENELEAMEIANSMETNEVSWSNDWEATDAEEDE